jgi:DNA polymerase II large subunit
MDLDKLNAKPHIKKYYEKLMEKINSEVDIAKKAKSKGRDISKTIETIPAAGIAEKTEVLIGLKGIAKEYNKYWEKYHDRFKVILEIFDKIIDGKIGDLKTPEQRLDKAIRTALIINTEGVVVSPLDGLPEIKISTNLDGSKYPDIYYAGPIRAAGGSAQTLPLLLADYARKKLHLDKYKPTEKEVNRIIEETMIYQAEIVSRQQRVTEEEIRVIAENCPVCINSGADSDIEVSVYRDIDRIPNNRIRGAMCLVLIDGVYVRALPNLDTSKELGLDWTWLEKLIKVKKTTTGSFELKPSTKYIEGLAAGRPVFAYPLKPGGFRLRYGRTRTSGLMAKAINPATMYVLDEFIAVGTHGRLERPGKALQYFPCSTIDGPIVRLKNKNVIQLNSANEAKEYVNQIEKILFLGDMLISVGDFNKSKHPLIKSGYVEEEWLAEIKYLYKNKKINEEVYNKALKFYENPNPQEAVNISINYNLPLFPIYTAYYDLLNNEELKIMIFKFRNAEKIFEDNIIVGAKIKNNNLIKDILEKIGLEHKLIDKKNQITIDTKIAYPLLKTFGALNAKDPQKEYKELLEDKEKSVLEKLKKISNLDIRDKSGTYIGARMGRPEAAHERIMPGKPNVLFPIGKGFGNSRDIIKASQKKSDNSNLENGIVEVEIKSYQCPSCKKIIYNNFCFDCNREAKPLRVCKKCNKIMFDEVCPTCNEKTYFKFNNKINIDNLLGKAAKNLNVGLPEVFKGVKGLVSSDKIPEPLEKGILRAKHEVYVFKDGTCRYEALNATITQFKPKEIGLTVEKTKKLGYEKDIYGNEIKYDDQIISIFPQDIIVDNNAGEYFLKVTKFIDDLLEKFYDEKKYFNYIKKEDLIGELVIGLAPHTSAGIVGRIIGFSKSRLGWGHPYFITAKRRNIDGDQDSMLLLMDALLNFSQKYLSKGRGGRMDAPLAFTTIVNPYEIDDEAYKIETVTEYPYEFYQNSKNYGSPKDKNIKFVLQHLGEIDQYDCIKYTHNTLLFDEGPKKSAYLTIESMKDKVEKQANLQAKIRAVDNKDALERLLHYHLFPDIIGNTRAFARQKLRCIKCNAKYRRIPLSGKCTCGGKLILTIHEGSIKKYLKIAKDIVKKYDLKPYLYQKIMLAEEDIESLFVDKESKNQKDLSSFF